jgi:proteic killer suppression protein
MLNSRIERICTEDRFAKKELGEDGAKVLGKRLKQMREAQNLEELRHAAGGWHELRDNRRGQLACSLHGLNRLVFVPAEEPRPIKPDGGLDWSEVTAVMNLKIVDYH